MSCRSTFKDIYLQLHWREAFRSLWSVCSIHNAGTINLCNWYKIRLGRDQIIRLDQMKANNLSFFVSLHSTWDLNQQRSPFAKSFFQRVIFHQDLTSSAQYARSAKSAVARRMEHPNLWLADWLPQRLPLCTVLLLPCDCVTSFLWHASKWCFEFTKV